MRLILLVCTCLFGLSAIAEPVEYATTLTIKSKAFASDRIIRVSLPTSYDYDTRSRYPIIYVVRGQLDLLATVASLNMLDKEVPSFIVVGIDGTLGDFFPSKDGRKTQFSRFVHDEVMPYIEQNYRTAPYRVLSAHSMAAIFSVNDWLDDGEAFSKYILISPPLVGGPIIKQFESKKEAHMKDKKPLLLTFADEGHKTESAFNTLNEMLAQTRTVSFKHFPEQTHMSGRVNAMMYGLRQEFPDWEPPKGAQNGMLIDLQQHYSMLSKRYGFKAVIPLDMLARMSGMGSMSGDAKQHQNAAAAVKYVLNRNENDAYELFDTAMQVASLGAIDASKRLISYICEEVPLHEKCE